MKIYRDIEIFMYRIELSVNLPMMYSESLHFSKVALYYMGR